MIQVKFYSAVEESQLRFAVMIAKQNGSWVFCKHKERETYEFPGGRREPGESIEETARRELYEETGAVDYELKPVGIISVTSLSDENEQLGEESFGMVYYAELHSLESELHYEIEKVIVTDQLPENWTYPEIQAKLFEKAKEFGYC